MGGQPRSALESTDPPSARRSRLNGQHSTLKRLKSAGLPSLSETRDFRAIGGVAGNGDVSDSLARWGLKGELPQRSSPLALGLKDTTPTPGSRSVEAERPGHRR